MTSTPVQPEHIGFLSVLETSSKGFLGGFLILDRSGHPAEFHCTVPVHANRAQEILYGETLSSFLCGSQIAPALCKHKKTGVTVIITDTPLLLSYAEKSEVPLLLILDPLPAGLRTLFQNSEIPSLAEICRIARVDPSEWTDKTEDGIRYAVRSADSGTKLTGILRQFRKMIDITEPFDRIYLAIKESQKGA